MSDLRALAEAATPGPWRHSGTTVWQPASPDDPTDFSGTAVCYIPVTAEEFDSDDAAYIAAVSPDRILALLDVVNAARDVLAHPGSHGPETYSAKVDRLRDALDRLP